MWCTEIRRRMINMLCKISENVLSEGSVREWCRIFNERRTDIQDGDGQVFVSVLGSECWFSDHIWAKLYDQWIFLKVFFSEISRPALHTVVRHLRYQKLCAGLQHVVNRYISSLTANFFEHGIGKHVSQCKKYLNVNFLLNECILYISNAIQIHEKDKILIKKKGSLFCIKVKNITDKLSFPSIS